MPEEFKQKAEEIINDLFPDLAINENNYYGKAKFCKTLVEFATEATKELQEENLKLVAKVRALEIEQHYCMPNCSKVTELEKQIEKMKCCGNCKHHRYTYGELECVTKGYENKCKWELAE